MASLNVFSQDFSINESPLGAPTSPVMDYAGVLDAGAKQALEKRIREFTSGTNPKVELAVAVVRTTGDRPIFDYSLAVARGWGIGSKEDDNPSALLFVAIDDRKYFTQVSKDLQDELPDGVVGQLQRQHLVPAFKQGDYTKGVSDTIEAFIRTIETKGNVAEQPAANEAPATGRTRERGGGRRTSGSLGGICCLFIAFIVIMAIFSRSSRRGGNDRDRWGGGGGGFGGGGGSVLPWVIGSVIANSISNSSSSGWGSSSSSGDWGGGSSGGDSWGGFGGGGDFDGGGAGGDW
ncbi:MAG TPA: TPM domain-containing protein [Pyrinomonadaceae bacterium]|nr:TPM domain-containing protein [Pyrinomonadaceae bacterium]